MKPFKDTDERGVRTWVFRIASLIAIFAVCAAIGLYLRRGDSFSALLLLFTVPFFAVFLSWNWTSSLFTSLEWAKRHVQGVEGNHRHEWYAFKGQRIRVFLDETQQPWFALNEIAFILGPNVDETTFRHYAPHECGIPESASERCLSESGLRRLIKYSTHPDASALGLWLEREVLRMLRNRRGRDRA